jgi:hypothetical protein
MMRSVPGTSSAGGGAYAMRRHIIHLAMKSPIQPRLQARFGCAQVAVGDAHPGKAEFAPPLFDLLRQLR